ncbi:Protein Simiate [Strongyloides ratti]|uniref:Protein Simiate n=1 Tax=Strongyloides ratti TaxID=34506 RepID=A0A090LJJ8_STRRB|nr:Protein Simiate [Strongyloides ratti]CEF68293.1 Protein Simiate [Strongyloides ratti]
MVDLRYETVVEKNYQRYEIEGYKDLCYIRHNSGVIVITLNKNHEAMNEEIVKVDWDVNKRGADKIKSNVSGKGKKGARNLFPDTKLCIITTKSDKKYPLKFGMRANCIEVNDRLENDPDLVRKHPENHGYLAIVMPTSDDKRYLPKVFKRE